MKFISFLILIVCFSCLMKKSKIEKTAKQHLTKSYVNIDFKQDTLEFNKKNTVKLQYYFKIADSLKTTIKDKRNLYLIVGLKQDNLPDDKKIKLSKELTFSPINSSDTIAVFFELYPKFLGKAKLIGVISDSHFLYGYHKEKMRMLSDDTVFEKEVFIK